MRYCRGGSSVRLVIAMKKLLVASLAIVSAIVLAIAVVETRRRLEFNRTVAALVERLDEVGAEAALVELGKPAVPVLSLLLEEPDRSLEQRQRCIEILASIGRDAKAAIPSIIATRNRVIGQIEEQFAIGLDATSHERLAPYYTFVRTADEALHMIRQSP